MKRFIMVMAVVMFSVAALSGRAYAIAIIDFSGALVGGSVITSGGTTTGAGIPITSLQVTGTPYTGTDGTGTFSVTNGLLNFSYGATNYITITGTISSNGLSVNSTDPLLSGSFASFTSGPYFVTGIGPDTKSASLLTALGLPSNTQFQFMSFTLYLTGNGIATSSDITNTSVPEPSALLLLGIGIAALGLWSRTRAARAGSIKY